MWRRTHTSIAASAMVVLAVTSAMTIVPAGSALAASPQWTIQNTPNVTQPNDHVYSVSCTSATSCTAVGSFLNRNGITDTLAEAWNGASWVKQSTPNPATDTFPAASPTLTGVSCPVAGFCEAVGSYEDSNFNGVILAQSWNGTAWTSQSVPAPAGFTEAALSDVSCTSPTFCEAVGFAFTPGSSQVPVAATWNGAAWSVQTVPVPASEIVATLGRVSCVSATFCMAAGGFPSIAEMWDGTAWTAQALPGGGGLVSCVSSSFCMSLGGTGATGSAIWNGSSWTPQPVQGPSGATSTGLSALSCSSAQACEAVGSYSTNVSTSAGPSVAEVWNGTSWTPQLTPNPAGANLTSLDAVSCPAAGSCEALGFFTYGAQTSDLQGVAEGWDGSAWSLQAAAQPPGAIPNALNGVSCVSSSFCEAVGTASDIMGNGTSLAEGWNGTSWKIQATPDPAAPAGGGTRAIMYGVSCVSASFCEAVGYSASGPGAAAWEWNGTSWTAQTVTGTNALVSVSCTSASFCMAMAGNGTTDSWNGTAWSQSAAIPGVAFASSVSCVSARFCEAIGPDASSFVEEAAEWNGTSWSLQSVPLPANSGEPSTDLLSVSCATAGSCTAVGWYFDTSFNQLTLAEHWNGSAWTVQASPNPAGSTVNVLDGVWCRSANFCAAVGDQQNSTTLADTTLVQIWNGSSWTDRTTPNRSVNDLDVLNSVWCGTGNSCTAVGIGSDGGEVNATLAETGG